MVVNCQKYVQEVFTELSFLSHDKIVVFNSLEAWKFIKYINPHRGSYIHQYGIWIWCNFNPAIISFIRRLDIPINSLADSTISISHEHFDLQKIFNYIITKVHAHELHRHELQFFSAKHLEFHLPKRWGKVWSQDRSAALTDGGWSFGW